MSERDAAVREMVEDGAARPETAVQPAGTAVQPTAAAEVSYADSLPALVLLVPATLLVRHLGEHGWAYWTAAVLGVLGVLASGVGIAAAVGSLRRGRRRLLAVYTIVALLAACFALAVRLFGS
ncbi:hypothetical protein ACLF6K_20700 [Streptomyces xanthophaeus]|uniref:hypothetical protein n=1 Tax=Streptomyces xanthophaeus TaxID=67385 RepID=UPI0039901E55